MFFRRGRASSVGSCELSRSSIWSRNPSASCMSIIYGFLSVCPGFAFAGFCRPRGVARR